MFCPGRIVCISLRQPRTGILPVRGFLRCRVRTKKMRRGIWVPRRQRSFLGRGDRRQGVSPDGRRHRGAANGERLSGSCGRRGGA